MKSINNHIEEKRILRLVYGIILTAFLIIGLYSNDNTAFLAGGFLIGLIAYGHFIIRKYFPDGDKYILVFAFFLSSIGMIMLYRIKPYYAMRQLTWLTIGTALFILIVVLFPDIEGICRYDKIFMGAALGLLLLTQILAVDVRGSRNWISLGFASFQPSEFAKVFIILYLASALNDYKERKDLAVPALVIFISLILLVLQKDLGSAIIFFGISVSMVYIGTSKLRYVLFATLLFLCGGAGSYLVFSHVQNRVNIWIDPWSAATTGGYQIVQSLFAIAWGGLMGTGLFLGHPNYIPEVHTDFIFAIICEEFGLLGGFAIIITYFLLIYRGFRTAIYAKDTFSSLVAVGISTMIGAQVFVIIGGVTKFIPLTGITLPLISYGGSSLVINFIALGILQKISESNGF